MSNLKKLKSITKRRTLDLSSRINRLSSMQKISFRGRDISLPIDYLIKKTKLAFDIFFADAKSTFERGLCFMSALFWLWLEWSFAIFFLTYAFGMYYAITGDYSSAKDLIFENKDFIKTMSIIVVSVITLLRVPLYKKKVIKA
ncbi:MAG TPA: hypothetical protein VJ438_05965 [Candidatus Nanoarchaeia archaeon]|nr:hypothetical protein [Candidatus Nanoarchaeia archaeon]